MFKYLVVIFLFSVLLGYFIGKFYPVVFGEKNENISKIDNEMGKTKDVEMSDSYVLETANLEEKLLPTAKLILEKTYGDCKHTVTSTVELPVEMYNLTEEQIREKYKDWTIKEFSKDNLILSKLENGLCNEHFVINSENGIVVVYKLDEDYNKSLYEKTNIYTEYLPEEDLEKLEQGIYVYGTYSLNSELENFE